MWTDPGFDCLHRKCDGVTYERPDDPYLPPHVSLHECNECGEVYELDDETGEIELAE